MQSNLLLHLISHWLFALNSGSFQTLIISVLSLLYTVRHYIAYSPPIYHPDFIYLLEILLTEPIPVFLLQFVSGFRDEDSEPIQSEFVFFKPIAANSVFDVY